MKRTVLAFAVAAFSIWGAAARAEQPLAVGEVAGYRLPPDVQISPVYNPLRGGRWEPLDRSFGTAFREPLYSTPRGYHYKFIRGYRVALLTPHIAVKHRVAHHRKSGPRVCVTDIGNGRYEECP